MWRRCRWWGDNVGMVEDKMEKVEEENEVG